jgi:hypothetical protein
MSERGTLWEHRHYVLFPQVDSRAPQIASVEVGI